MARKYSSASTKGDSVKEHSPAQRANSDLRHATAEEVEKAISHVVKVHGTALQKLAK